LSSRQLKPHKQRLGRDKLLDDDRRVYLWCAPSKARAQNGHEMPHLTENGFWRQLEIRYL
jgi:hypothetical protein